jgi:hypothetical protein
MKWSIMFISFNGNDPCGHTVREAHEVSAGSNTVNINFKSCYRHTGLSGFAGLETM